MPEQRGRLPGKRRRTLAPPGAPAQIPAITTPPSFTDPSAALAAGLRDRYVLERELGRGGMATVYLARDVKHERPVALKVLLPELAASLGPDRFKREIKFAARLQHPHILSVHDSGETAGQLWFTMPFVDGESLRDRLRRGHRLSLEEAVAARCNRTGPFVWSRPRGWRRSDRAEEGQCRGRKPSAFS